MFDFFTAVDWDCVAAVERLPALHYSVDFIFLSFGIMGFHQNTCKNIVHYSGIKQQKETRIVFLRKIRCLPPFDVKSMNFKQKH